MGFRANSRPWASALLAVAATGLLVWFGTGLNPWWPLLWLAPIPVLLFSLRTSWRSASLVAGLAWFAGGLNLWHYLGVVLHVPPAPLAVIFVVPAVLFAVAVTLFRGLISRGAYWSGLLAFPAAWVSFEYLINLVSPHGTGGNISYSQLNFLPVLQLASVTGPWGISFLLFLFPASLVTVFHLRQKAPRQARQIAAATLVVLTVVLLFGVGRLTGRVAESQVKVGLIASDQPANSGVVKEGPQTARMLREYAAEAEQLASQGARVIVMPEKLGVVVDPETTATDALLQSLADTTKATVVVGLVQVSSPWKYNRARVYLPGAPPLNYDKHHMLPPFESQFKPGTMLTMLPEPSASLGVAICKDMDFTPLSRRYGHAGAGLMLVPAWDFVLDRWSHGHMAVMRGVENGFSIARAAKQGYLTVSDDRGRILAEAQSDSAPFATLLVDVPAAHHRTIYLVLGDWFAWLSLGILIFALSQLRRPSIVN
ncbi:MAG: nitrilase-related carbon-nitrogen hydrolase [Bryobacteraceae bacterium]